MSGPRIELVPPREGLIAAVSSRLSAGGRDHSAAWIVFPGKRPAYYLRKVLAGREGAGFLPPRIDSFESFVDRVCRERLDLSGRAIDVYDAVAILLEIHRSAPDRLGRDRFLEADRFFPLGVKLFHDLEDLAAAGVEASKLLEVEGWADEAIPERTRERFQRLSFFSERFGQELDRRGLSTPASRSRAVAARIEPGLFPDIRTMIFAGFFPLAGTETTILQKLLDWPAFRLLLLKGKGIGSVLDRLGVDDPGLRAAALTSDPGPGPEVEFVKSPDTHGQIFALNGALRDRLADPSRFDERQVVVLPAAETLFPLYQQTLASLPEESFNISLGYPLARTPIFSFFEKLLELVQSMDEDGRVFAPHYLRFVLHPYTKNLYFPGRERRADLTRILFHAVEDELIRRRTRGFWRLDEIESDEGIRKSVQERSAGVENAPSVADFLEHLARIHAATIAPFRMVRDVGDLAAKLAGVLDHIYGNSTARLHTFFHPYAEAFMGQLGDLGRSLLRDVSFEEKGSYFNLFRKVVAAGTVPFTGTPLRGLQVLGFWETRGIPFEEVHLLDMNEKVIPAFSRVDSLLPVGARIALGLPTYRDEERRMEHYLDTLVRGARTVRVFFVENNDRERSRFVERLLWERQKREGAKDGTALVRTVEYRVALQGSKPSPVEKTASMAEFLRRFRYSATALDSYLGCPLRFYYAYVLDLREKEEVAEGVEKRDTGTFVHAVLESYYGRFVGRPLRAAELRAADMEALVDRMFPETFGKDLSGAAYLMKIQVRRHLADLISSYQAPLVEALEAEGKSLVIQALERKDVIEREVRPRTAPRAPARVFKLSTKVDRVELRGDDLFVLDYKTSYSVLRLGIDWKKIEEDDRSTWSRAVKSLQLPLYAIVLAGLHGRTPADVHGRFVMLGRNRLGPEIEFSPIEEVPKGETAASEERRERMETAGRLIDALLLEIADPGTPFAPVPEGDEACRFCPYKGFCGRP